MTISIHLISVPDEEVINSRVAYLPENGGSIGRATSCDIYLPDQSKRISRLHGEFKLTESGYSFVHRGKNTPQLNGKSMSKDKEYLLNDGDIISLEKYSMLVSTLIPNNGNMNSKSLDSNSESTTTFNLVEDETDFLELDELPPEKSSTSSFFHKNILSDDPFASDPFGDLEDKDISPHIEIDDLKHSPRPGEQKGTEYLPVGGNLSNSHLERSLERLLNLTEKQQALQSPMFDHDSLFDALELTVEQFLKQLAPRELENQFKDYLTGGVFSSKDKRYWRIYKKHFQHRQDNGDFHRQFKALFLENMRKQRENNQ